MNDGDRRALNYAVPRDRVQAERRARTDVTPQGRCLTPACETT